MGLGTGGCGEDMGGVNGGPREGGCELRIGRQGIGRTGRSRACELLLDRHRRLFRVVGAAAMLFHPRMARMCRRTHFRRSPTAPRTPKFNPQLEKQ